MFEINRLLYADLSGSPPPNLKKGYNRKRLRFNTDTIPGKYEMMSVSDIVRGYAHHCMSGWSDLTPYKGEGNG